MDDYDVTLSNFQKRALEVFKISDCFVTQTAGTLEEKLVANGNQRNARVHEEIDCKLTLKYSVI